MRYILFIFFIHLSVCNFAQIDAISDLKSKFELAIINKDAVKKSELATQLASAYSANIYIYYNSVLKHLPKKAMLVVNGTEDLFPLLILQTTKNINPSVDIISLKLLNENSVYANSILKSYKLNTEFDKTSESIYLSRLLKQKKAPIFLSTTVSSASYVNHVSSLFVAGAVLGYNSVAQYEKLNRFYNSKKIFLDNTPKLTLYEKQLFTNYLPALLTLYKMQIQLNDVNLNLKKHILSLANSVGKKESIENILNRYNQLE